MIRIAKFLLLLFIIFSLVECSVKKDYDLSESIDKTITAGSQVQIPIGSFKILSIKNILSHQAKNYITEQEDGSFLFDPKGETLTNFYLGDYHLKGLGFVSLFDYQIPTVRFFFKVRNSIPLGYELKCIVTDVQGNEIDGIISKIDTNIPAGSLQDPSFTDVVLEIYPKSLSGFGFDGFRLSLIIAQMPTSTLVIDHKAGISLNSVVLQLPEGLKFKLGDKIEIF